MMTMRRFRSCFLTLFLFCVFTVPVFGTFDNRFGVSGYGGGAFCIPTSSYLTSYPGDASVKMPAFRTSGSFGVDLEVLQFRFGREDSAFFIGLGLSYVGVSQSIAYGASVLRPYNGIGAFCQLGCTYNQLFSLSFLFRLLYCWFPKVKQVFIMYDFGAIPTFELASFGPVGLYVVTPLTVSIKTDAVTLRVSCGLKLDVSLGKISESGRAENE